ncbi:glutaminase [Microbacterium amylolyticum]|uniref:glutaminase n=1 Tax=Microbacterium amylolyticum TaxID=936337 RepID=A0ABS4ZH30_9MICO|nr:glutaminase [Microbacterium amylolyticum]MBP2436588.1 glutaminase [Microbacterium amylolyticum]
MQTPMVDYVQYLLDSLGEDGGEVAAYIPELANANPDRLAIAIADHGLDHVLDYIDVEPSGDAFNEISLDPETGKPRNPIINAGAIGAHALVRGDDADARVGRILDLYSRLAGRTLSIAEDVFESELSEADRNMGLAYMLRNAGTLEGDPSDIVRGYTRQCSASVTVRDLARMADGRAARPACHGRVFAPSRPAWQQHPRSSPVRAYEPRPGLAPHDRNGILPFRVEAA